MDCEKFDRVVLDLLYEELDEITSAAAKRHMEHCTRCRDISTRLRATREVGSLPLVDPPEGLELKILNAERRARRELPARKRVGRAISILAGYAMRPQLAMAALLLLVIGSSLLLLRARPGEQKSLLVTERGVPEGEPESVGMVARSTPEPAASRTPEARDDRRLEARNSERAERFAQPPSAAAPALKAESGADAPASELSDSKAAEADRAYEDALSAYRDRKYEKAQRRFNEVAARGGENAASAALYAAQSARANAGCPTAAPLFDEVYRKYPDSQPGREAAWQAAGCYRTLGDFERARQAYEMLLNASGYADRAQAALASLGDVEPSATAAEAHSAPPARSKAAAAAAKPTPNAKTDNPHKPGLAP